MRFASSLLNAVILLGALGCAGPTLAADADADLAANKALVRAAVEQMFGGRDSSLAKRFVAADYIEHNPRLQGGNSGVVTYLDRMRTAFPDDYHADITQILSEGDRVLVFIRWHGIQSGPFLGVAPTGREITFTTADIWRVRDGQLAEHWDVVDRSERDLALGLVARTK